MARQPWYEDCVAYKADVEAEEPDERFDPQSGRSVSEVAFYARQSAVQKDGE